MALRCWSTWVHERPSTVSAVIDLASLPFVPCNHRTARTVTDLVVVHTNEGDEGTRAAEGLAAYLQHVDPGYNVVVDQDSAVRTAGDHEAVWGAGGVNHRAWHLCLTGWSAQTAAQWDDASSRGELALAAHLVRQACDLLGVPRVRITDPRNQRGICGHGDVSRYYADSMGHTDPGPAFPWAHFIDQVNGNVVVTPPQPPPPPPIPTVSQEDDVPDYIAQLPWPTELGGDGNLHTFWLQGMGKELAHRWDGKTSKHDESITDIVHTGAFLWPQRPHPWIAPNGTLCVSVLGSDGTENTYASIGGHWVPQTDAV